MRRLRGRTVAIPVMAVLTTLAVMSGAAHAETVDPDGVGGLLPAPAAPTGGGTMYETYPHLHVGAGVFTRHLPAAWRG
ncbi:hypothetical protein [Streptomyces virginiae]|uniref:hypothetical protein n=1 Tax=Streptomyces virginiae TaxID=1961 RepID=UPI002F91BB20